MTDTGKQQRKAEAERMMAAGRVPRGPAPGSQPAGRNPQGQRAPQGQPKPGASGDDDEERVLDIDDEEE
jgi:hypothetical protein